MTIKVCRILLLSLAIIECRGDHFTSYIGYFFRFFSKGNKLYKCPSAEHTINRWSLFETISKITTPGKGSFFISFLVPRTSDILFAASGFSQITNLYCSALAP